MSREVKKYTKEYKTEAVKLALKSTSISSAAKGLGIPVASLHTWIRKIKEVKPSPEVTEGISLSSLIEENRRLQKENTILKEEKDILKKAATYFAAHQK
jgi:transposase